MSFQDFQKSPNKLNSREIWFLALATVVIALTLAALGYGNYYLASILPEGGEFYLLRIGGRAFLFDQIEPYSGMVPVIVQEQLYGRAALAGGDAYILDLPFHLMLLFFPLALFPDVLMARAFWMALTELAFVASLIFGFRLLRRQIPLVFVILIFVAGLTSLYAYFSLLEGSPTIMLGLASIGILLALRAELDELAGALIVLSSFLWEISAPFLLFIVLWAFWERRGRVFAGGGMLAFILMLISYLWYPGWLLPFLRAAWNSFRDGFGYSSHEILAQLWPKFGSTLAWVLTAVLIVLLSYEWGAARGANFLRVVWVSCFSMVAAPLFGWRVEMDQLVFLTFPIMLVIIISRERWRKFGNGIAIMLLLLFFGLPWFVYAQGFPWKVNLSMEEILFLIWPIAAFIGLYWVRWWMIRPLRTWLDIATQGKH